MEKFRVQSPPEKEKLKTTKKDVSFIKFVTFLIAYFVKFFLVINFFIQFCFRDFIDNLLLIVGLSGACLAASKILGENFLNPRLSPPTQLNHRLMVLAFSFSLIRPRRC